MTYKLLSARNVGNFYFSFGWLDFTLPMSYVAGDPITVNIAASIEGSGVYDPDQCALQVFGFQFDGGSYTDAAVVTVAGTTSLAPGVTIYNYCDRDLVATIPTPLTQIKSQFITPTPNISSFTIPGTTQARQNGVGGAIVENGNTVPGGGGIAGLGYTKDRANGFGAVQWWQNTINNSGGYVFSPAGATVPQIANGTHPLQPGATFSIGIYGFSLSFNNWVAITDISVVTTGGVVTEVPITGMRCGFAGGYGNNPIVSPAHLVAPLPVGSLLGPPQDFYLGVVPLPLEIGGTNWFIDDPVEIRAFKVQAPHKALDTYLEIGPMQYEDQKEADETSQISSLIVGLSQSEISPIVYIDYLDDDSGDEDWNDIGAPEDIYEDWLDDFGVEDTFDLTLVAMVDGLTEVFDGEEHLDVVDDLGSSKGYGPEGKSGIMHKLVFRCNETGQKFALKFVEIAGMLTGRLWH